MDIERLKEHDLYVLRDIVSGLEEEQSIDPVIARQFEKVIDEALQAYQPAAIPKTETTSCEWCEGNVSKYFDVNWYDFNGHERLDKSNYCPACGRKMD